MEHFEDQVADRLAEILKVHKVVVLNQDQMEKLDQLRNKNRRQTRLFWLKYVVLFFVTIFVITCISVLLKLSSNFNWLAGMCNGAILAMSFESESKKRRNKIESEVKAIIGG